MIRKIRHANEARKQWYRDNGGIVPHRPEAVDWCLDRLDRMRQTLGYYRDQRKAWRRENDMLRASLDRQAGVVERMGREKKVLFMALRQHTPLTAKAVEGMMREIRESTS